MNEPENTLAILGLSMTALPLAKRREPIDFPGAHHWSVVVTCAPQGSADRTMECEYSMGSAHMDKVPYAQAARQKHGMTQRDYDTMPKPGSRMSLWQEQCASIVWKPKAPTLADVMHSLTMDASVLDCRSFEDWAAEYGYDTDSRKAEQVYDACLKSALELRALVGDSGLRALQSAFQEY
jgi:hypothetical protein